MRKVNKHNSNENIKVFLFTGLIIISLFGLVITFSNESLIKYSGETTTQSEFQLTGSINIPRDAGTYTLTKLANGKLLIVGGVKHELICKRDCSIVASMEPTSEVYDPSTGQWSASGSSILPRAYHTATLLSNGKVLITGGTYDYTSLNPTATAEIYDPITGTFSSVGNNMITARAKHSSVLLKNGKVLIIAGDIGGVSTAAAEIYDPTSNTFSSTGNLVKARSSTDAVLLQDGRVLVLSGATDYSSEIYSPNTGLFSTTGSFSKIRNGAIPVLLPNGKVLTTGGMERDSPTSNWVSSRRIELFDPTSVSFSDLGLLMHVRNSHIAELLSNGKVLVAGGRSTYTKYDDAELVDPNTGTSTYTNSMSRTRSKALSALLPNGFVIIVGGHLDTNQIDDDGTCEIYVYDINTDTTPPTVSITSPQNGGSVYGIVIVNANAIDNVGISKVEFYIDNVLKSTDTSSPYSYSWDSSPVIKGSHIIRVKAYDSSGNTASKSITINVIRPSTDIKNIMQL